MTLCAWMNFDPNTNWPGIIRAAGFLLGFGSIAAWALDGRPPDGGVMTWAAALILIPNLQSRRSSRSDREQDEHEQSQR